MSGSGNRAQPVGAWEGYWRHTEEAAAHRAGGRQEPLLALFWTDLFRELLDGAQRLRVLDVACGNGAALGYLLQAADGGNATVHAVGLDGSVSALRDLQRRLPVVSTVAADARFPPFADHTFDVVCSQYGVEYGGEPALIAAGRLVRPGGTFAAVMHLRDGGIYRECAQNLRAIDAIAALLPVARVALRVAIDSGRGRGGGESITHDDQQLVARISAVESLLRQYGSGVAGGFISRLYRDIGHMLRNPARFDGAEVDAWLVHMQDDVAAYRGRMEGMLGAALNEPQYNGLMTRLAELGLQVRPAEQLGLGVAGAAGWILVGRQRT